MISPSSRKKVGVDTSLAEMAAADAAARGSLAAAHVTVWWPRKFFCFFPGTTLSWHVRDKSCRPAVIIVRGAPLRPHRRGVAAVPLRVAIIVSSFEERDMLQSAHCTLLDPWRAESGEEESEPREEKRRASGASLQSRVVGLFFFFFLFFLGFHFF